MHLAPNGDFLDGMVSHVRVTQDGFSCTIIETLIWSAMTSKAGEGQTCIESCTAHRVTLCPSKIKFFPLVAVFHHKLTTLQLNDVSDK